MTFKLLFSLLWIFLSTGAYVHYFWSILQWQTKPHMFTWLIFSVLLISSFAIQTEYEGGLWTYIILSELIGCFLAFLLSLKYGEKHITLSDKIFLALAFGALALWLLFDLPTLSVILIILVDLFALLPTFRKSFSRPQEETIVLYLVSGFIFIFSLLGMQNYSFLTVWHQTAIILFDWGLAAFILLRRYQLTK